MGLGGDGGSKCDREGTQERRSGCRIPPAGSKRGPRLRATLSLSPTMGCKGTSN